jgi:polyhydroxyalkanoate synthase
VKAIKPMLDLVPNAPSVRFEVVPGGHLGMLTGRASRTTTWRIIDEFLDEHASDVPPKKAAKKATKKAAAKKKAPRRDAIGANPSRRYASSSTRSLASGS